MDENTPGLSPHAARVAHFMRLAGQDLPNAKGIPAQEVVILRIRLIWEELFETLDAMGVAVWIWARTTPPKHHLLHRPLISAVTAWEDDGEVPLPVNFVELVDGLLDLNVVTTGTTLACGSVDAFESMLPAIPGSPVVPEPQLRQHFGELLLASALHVTQWLGASIWVQGGSSENRFGISTLRLTFEHITRIEAEVVSDSTFFRAVDASCDALRQCTSVILRACQVPEEQLQQLVDENNLAKFGPGGRRNPETGKWEKPPGHKPPDIRGELNKLGWNG